MLVVSFFVNDVTWELNFAWTDDAIRSLAAHLILNTLISYETILLMGTLQGRLKPMIKETSGLKEGTGLYPILSPERVLTDRVFVDLRRYPKPVGGLDEVSIQTGTVFCESALDFGERDDLPHPNGVRDMGIVEAAETAKLTGITYRDANIGPVNQFAVYTGKAGSDAECVIEAHNPQPYSHIHHPGIAVDRHYIPVYPCLYLSTDLNAPVVRTVCTFGTTIPVCVVGRVIGVLDLLKGLCVVVLGASYCGKTKETAFSDVFPTVEALHEAGTEVLACGPTYINEELVGFG